MPPSWTSTPWRGSLRICQAAKAAELLRISVRQVKRLCRLFKDNGLAGLASRQRGQPSNRKLAVETKAKVVALVREQYSDFGPKLAHEKLVEVHGIRVGRETLRGWLIEAGVWLPRAERTLRVHQPRHRRQCLGELVQIDGCDHEWFEARADRCTALVYVDDATGKLKATLRGERIGVRLFCRHGVVPRPPRQTGGVLQ